jgi:ribosome maturation factor RimP
MDKRLEHIKERAKPVIEGVGYYLLDALFEIDGEMVIWILVECEEGPVTLDTCANLSREIGFVLEAHDLMSDRYRLNVSSPGLERPLTDTRQFQKNKGRKLRILLNNEVMEGDLIEYSGNVLKLSSNGETIELNPSDASEIRVIPQF